MSMSSSIRKVVTAMVSSPCAIAYCTGAAPRQRGSAEKCAFTQPRRGSASRSAGISTP